MRTRQVLVAVFSFSFLFLMPSSALAATKISAVHSKRLASGVAVDLTFDKSVDASKFKPEFERNFVQFVLTSTKMDAAKLLPVTNSKLQKVFVYPYSPEVTRVRLILDQSHEWAKDRIRVSNANSKTVRVFISDPEKAESAVTTEEAGSIDIHDPESLKDALNNGVQAAAVPAAPPGAMEPAAVAPMISSAVNKEPIGLKSDPSRHFVRMAVALTGILALFIGLVFIARRYASKLKKLPFGKKERVIQVVATHYLGSKKSISMVKVAGEYMVVGVSNEGISLITKLDAEMNVDKYLEDRFWNGTFEKHLNKYASYDGVKDLAGVEQKDAVVSDEPIVPGPSLIRQGIRDKLTKLKRLS